MAQSLACSSGQGSLDYHHALTYLDSLELRGWKFGLGRTRALLDALGSPDKQLAIVHVAGTNGKGSVCAMLDAILQQAGYVVGRYTSPHLVRVTERFTINGTEISETEFARLVSCITPHVTDQTYFEVLTAIALLYFYQHKVDYAILEVGLGGRLDATNVVTPVVSVITTISREHTDYLGTKLADIAREKAGIVKPGVPVVTGTRGTALSAIQRVCREQGSRLLVVPLSRKVETNLLGDFQRKNAAVSEAAAEVLATQQHFTLPEATILEGLQHVTWPGRLEFVGRNVLLDCAHNPAAMEALAGFVMSLSFPKIITVFGVLRDKDYRTMLRRVNTFSDALIITKVPVERGLDAAATAAVARKIGAQPIIKENVADAVSAARSLAGSSGLVLITGSCYLVGAVKDLLARYGSSAYS